MKLADPNAAPSRRDRTTVTMRSGAATPRAASSPTTSCRPSRARSCSTSSTASRPSDAPDLACRWNCKAGKCGSCSAEINGQPRLMCMTRMDTLPEGEPVTVAPMKTFPIIRDLVTDVSFNYEVAKTIPAFKPGPEPEGGYRMAQIDVERGQEFRKCIECFMCQDVCHVIRDHEENKPKYAGPRFFIRFAELEMHPLDVNDRRELAHDGAASACATSPSAAPRCAPSTSRSPTTPSSR